jgi:DNA-binding GntR family transcriptional regulator
MVDGLSLRTNQSPRLESINIGVYEKLKSMISEGELRPGDRLVQKKLAKELGTSPTPVIESLRRLERDGLVVHVPHLGSFVRESTVEDITELYCLRRAIECEACVLFVEQATDLEVNQLLELDSAVDASAAAEDVRSLMDADMSFHLHIVTTSRVARLRDILSKGQVEERIFMAAPEWQSNQSMQRICGIHKTIVAAIVGRDAAAASAAMRKHLLKAEQEYINAGSSK